MSAVPQTENLVNFTDAAARRVQELISQEGNYNLRLRVYITGGGCSGFQYGFGFDEKLRSDDVVIEKKLTEGGSDSGSEGLSSISVVIDAVSFMYLQGAQIDYVANLKGAHFTVQNPNAQTTCSCGSSFSL